MTTSAFCRVALKPDYYPAIRFDGTPEMAQIIIDWVCAAAPELGRGHHRPACGGIPAAVFQPMWCKTLMALAGQWVVQNGRDGFVAYSAEAFAAKFEICP